MRPITVLAATVMLTAFSSSALPEAPLTGNFCAAMRIASGIESNRCETPDKPPIR
jgi:hypothetical protein